MQQKDAVRILRSNSVSNPKRALTSSRSCPPSRRPSLPSRSFVRQESFPTGPVPKLPPLPRGSSGSHGNINGSGATVRFSVADADPKNVESSTSSSPLHGVILVIIMIASLIAFLCTKIKDLCEDQFIRTTPSGAECSAFASLLFSLTNIGACLFCFVTYFLHLVGQCDYAALSARRKVCIEISATSAMTALLVFSIGLAVHQTVLIHDGTDIAGAIFSVIGVLFCVLRVLMLLKEARSLARTDEYGMKRIPELGFGYGASPDGADNPVALRAVSKSLRSLGPTSSVKKPARKSSASSSGSATNGATPRNTKATTNPLEYDDDDDVFVDVAV